jgi:hypothetical protein
VVISNVRDPALAPIVPKRSPTAHTESAHPRSNAFTSVGRASVVRSKSPSTARFNKRSRTVPPTR